MTFVSCNLTVQGALRKHYPWLLGAPALARGVRQRATETWGATGCQSFHFWDCVIVILINHKLQLNITDTILSEVCHAGCRSPRKDATSQVGTAGTAVPWLQFEAVTSRSIHQRNIAGGWPKHELKRQRQRLKTQLWWFEEWIFSCFLAWFASLKDANVSTCINQEIRGSQLTAGMT